jgi:Flp pilus assembly protein TadB
MAQTKRKRSTKHRGNAAGSVEARGRTGRKPTLTESDPKARQKQAAKAKKVARADKPPSWRSAFLRAPMMALILFPFGIVLFKSVVSALAILPIAVIIYIPTGYYTDVWAYNRRQRRKQEGQRRR